MFLRNFIRRSLTMSALSLSFLTAIGTTFFPQTCFAASIADLNSLENQKALFENNLLAHINASKNAKNSNLSDSLKQLYNLKANLLSKLIMSDLEFAFDKLYDIIVYNKNIKNLNEEVASEHIDNLLEKIRDHESKWEYIQSILGCYINICDLKLKKEENKLCQVDLIKSLYHLNEHHLWNIINIVNIGGNETPSDLTQLNKKYRVEKFCIKKINTEILNLNPNDKTKLSFFSNLKQTNLTNKCDARSIFNLVNDALNQINS